MWHYKIARVIHSCYHCIFRTLKCDTVWWFVIWYDRIRCDLNLEIWWALIGRDRFWCFATGSDGIGYEIFKIWYNLVRLGSIEYDQMRFIEMRFDMMRNFKIWYNNLRWVTMKCNEIWHDMVWNFRVRFDRLRSDLIEYDMIRSD